MYICIYIYGRKYHDLRRYIVEDALRIKDQISLVNGVVLNVLQPIAIRARFLKASKCRGSLRRSSPCAVAHARQLRSKYMQLLQSLLSPIIPKSKLPSVRVGAPSLPPLSSFPIRRNALQRQPSPRPRCSDGSAVRLHTSRAMCRKALAFLHFANTLLPQLLFSSR